MDKLRKQELIYNLHRMMRSYKAIIVTKNVNISVAEVNDLRCKVKQSGGHYRVVKNRLTKIAVQSTCYKNLVHFINGPTALVYSNDPVLISKTLVDFCSKNKSIQILGGAIGEVCLTAKEVQELALLPSIDESRIKIVKLLNNSISKLTAVLQASVYKILSILNVYSYAEHKFSSTFNKNKVLSKETMSNLEKIIEELSTLTVTQAAELAKMLEAKWGISVASAPVAVTTASTPATSSAVTKTEFDLMLIDYGANKLNVIKEVRALTGLGLKEAKDLVESAPKVVKYEVPKEEAEKNKQLLEAAGAKVELK